MEASACSGDYAGAPPPPVVAAASAVPSSYCAASAPAAPSPSSVLAALAVNPPPAPAPAPAARVHWVDFTDDDPLPYPMAPPRLLQQRPVAPCSPARLVAQPCLAGGSAP